MFVFGIFVIYQVCQLERVRSSALHTTVYKSKCAEISVSVLQTAGLLWFNISLILLIIPILNISYTSMC